MNLTISDEAYEKYINKEQAVTNKRLRDKNEDFLDALLSVDMAATPERREVLEAIRQLK